MNSREVQRAVERALAAHARRQSFNAVVIVVMMAIIIAVAAWFILGPQQLNEMLGTSFKVRARP